VEITKYPAERAIKLANEGGADGEVARIDGIGNHYPNLIQVYPAVNYIEATVFTAGKDLVLEGWQSLQPFSIGYIRGIKFAETNTTGMDRYAVGDYPTLFRMLHHDRFDFAVSPRLNGEFNKRRMDMAGIVPLEPPIEQFDLYHYVHRNHAALVPKLEAVLQEMLDSGELTAIRERVVTEILRRADLGLPICDEDYLCFEPDTGAG
jgi:polar amino acid transport system substrate-binding protein